MLSRERHSGKFVQKPIDSRLGRSHKMEEERRRSSCSGTTDECRKSAAAIGKHNRRGRSQPTQVTGDVRAGVSKGAVAMIYGEPETLRFLVALQRLKRQQRKKERQTRLAKLRVRAALRKMREC
jgi:hypothetical protein